MNTKFHIDNKPYHITHMGTKVLDANHYYAAGHPFLQVDPMESGYRVVIFRQQYASGKLVVSSDAFIPNEFMEMVMKNTASITSLEGKKIYRLEGNFAG